MAGHFLDSSALVKLYHSENGSAIVEDLMGSAATILISRLAVVEVQSALAGKVRLGVISAGAAAGLRHRFLEDIAKGLLTVAALAGAHYDDAGELVGRHGASYGLRTLDSLQLAVALSLHRTGAVENLVAATRSSAEGLRLNGCRSLIPSPRHCRYNRGFGRAAQLATPESL